MVTPSGAGDGGPKGGGDVYCAENESMEVRSSPKRSMSSSTCDDLRVGVLCVAAISSGV